MSYAAYRRERFSSTLWRDIKNAWKKTLQDLHDWYELEA